MADPVDPFDNAFAQLIKDDDKEGGSAPPALTPAPAVVDPTPETKVEAPVAQIEEPTEIEGAPPVGETEDQKALREAAEAQAARAAQQPAQGQTEETLARLAEMLAHRDAVAAARAQPRQEPHQAAVFDQETAAFLNQYEQDYPDVARAERTVRRAEYNALTTHIFREVAAFIAPQMQLLSQLADRTAYTDLAQRVPNYDDNREKVVAWVKTQPTYLQPAFNHAIQNGTVEEIGDLFDRFSRETGAPSPQAAPQPGRQAPPSPARQADELSPAAKQAAARLAPVNSKRTAPTQGAPMTFDSGFDAAVKELMATS